MTKWSIHLEDITIINIYSPKNSLKYMKQKLTEIKEERQFNKIWRLLYSNFNNGQNNKAEDEQIVELNNTIDQLDLIEAST